MAVTGRFAPSPSGRIHLGNILCCLLAWLSARQKGGRVILRIEDLDIARCPRRYGEQMCRDIQWLGLDWDEGPVIGGPSGPYEQSRRTALYQAALRRLEAQGLVYPCFCTRAELHAASAPHREDGQVVYPGTCRGLTAEQAAERARRCGCRRRRSLSPTATWGSTGSGCLRTAGIFCCGGRTAYLPINWRWWWMTRPWASQK